jgi:multisubunit Na+/H+ antiporter MnhG subunit
MAVTGDGQQPETRADVVRRRWRAIVGWALVGLGALFILLGWIGVSGEPDVARQMSYLASGGIGGLTAAIVGVGLLVSEDLRTDRRRLGRIEATLLDVSEAVTTARRSSRATSRRGR